ncbi:hypothetical protein KCV07_g7971, partial [Aureobasidium melanogenum]
MSATEIDSRALFSKNWRLEVDQMVSGGTQKDSKDLGRMVQDLIHNLAQRHNNHSNQTAKMGCDLHDLWYTLIQAASISDAESPNQDTLTSYVIHARELGPFTRRSEGKPGEAYRGTKSLTQSESQGGFENLRYLASDLEEFWLNTSWTLSPLHRQNISAFTARLVALGVQDKQIVPCGTYLTKQTLEVPQSSTQLVGETTTSLEDLLPAAMAWISYARHKTLKLSIENHSLSQEWTTPGSLASAGGITANSLSLERWCFWKLRLEDSGRSCISTLSPSIEQCLRSMEAAEHDLGVDLPRRLVTATQMR